METLLTVLSGLGWILLMSVLFISMFARRGSMEGQSLLLAVSKWIGTLAPTILMGIIHYDALCISACLSNIGKRTRLQAIKQLNSNSA